MAVSSESLPPPSSADEHNQQAGKAHYPVVVIGAGPAGSTAAYTLASRGIRTCIVDRHKFPRDKLCGGLLTLRSKKVFEAVYTDPWFWALFAAIWVFSYYTGLGLLFLLKTIDLVRAISSIDLVLSPYAKDETGGLGFVGEFSITASAMLSSGMLFLPLLVRLGIGNAYAHDYIALVVCVLYGLMVILLFLIPVLILHFKIKAQKKRLAEPLREALQAAEASGHLSEWNVQSPTITMKRALLIDIFRIGEWPVTSTIVLRVATVAMSPALAWLARQM